MAWYWIITIILGILLVWAWTAAVMYKYFDLDDVSTSIISIIPLVWVFAVYFTIYQFLKKIV